MKWTLKNQIAIQSHQKGTWKASKGKVLLNKTKQALPIHNQFTIKKCHIKQFNNASFSFDAWPGWSWWVHTWSAPTPPFRHAETPRQAGMPTYQRCVAAGPCRYRARLRAMQGFLPRKISRWQSQMLNLWPIYLQNWVVLGVNIGKYRYIEHLRMVNQWFEGVGLLINMLICLRMFLQLPCLF